MLNNSPDISTKFRARRILLPLIIGLAVVLFFVYRDFQKIEFSLFNFTKLSLVFLLLAFVFLAFRDFGYVLRMRVLSSKELSWLQCVKIVLLWEFGSAITPSAVGGTAIATVFLWKEGLNVGKSTAIVLATSFLDELYFSLLFPIILFSLNDADIFTLNSNNFFIDNLFLFVMIGYFLKLLWTIIIGYSIFINPNLISKIFRIVFRLPFLKTWKQVAEKVANDYNTANFELKGKGLVFWVKSFFASFISWTSRYFVLNILFISLLVSSGASFFDLSIYDHLLIFARQLMMWILMLVMPSPGASGLIEGVFASFMSDFVCISGFSIIMALVWRLVTYYPYLIIGAILAPHWLRNNFKKKSKIN